MSLGPLMVGICGIDLDAGEAEYLRHPLVGGVILFQRNYRSPDQIRALVAAIHELREPRLLVAVDHEGGRIQRFTDGFSHLPAARTIGELFNSDSRRAKRIAETSGWLMASELRAVGVDFSFAPVVDLDWGSSTVIGDRAFHRKPEVVAELGRATMNGMHKAGMAAVAKHFPGHGYVREDTHLHLTVDRRSLDDILFNDGIPFERMAHYGVAAVMCSHVIYPDFDALPAGFSPRWINDILRARFGFSGVVFSDDLNMCGAALIPGLVERVGVALDAGCDMVVIGQQPETIPALLDRLLCDIDPVSAVRLARMHGRHAATWEQLHRDPAWSHAVKLILACDPPENLELL